MFNSKVVVRETLTLIAIVWCNNLFDVKTFLFFYKCPNIFIWSQYFNMLFMYFYYMA